MSIVLASGVLLSLSSCNAPHNQNETAPVTVAAASDLAPLGDELAALFQEQSGFSCTFVFGASGALRRQIEQGAPYDVFLSANEHYVEDLAREGFVDAGTVVVYAVGTLGFWTPEPSSEEITALLEGEGVRRIAIPNPQFAPYGVAARDFLQRAGLWETLQPKLVFGENVRQTTQYAASGNVDALISSWTLVKPLGGRQIPADRYHPIRQAAGVCSRTPHREKAQAFLRMISGAAGKRLLEAHDFLISPEVAVGPEASR